jgi:hypothetical protein
MALRQAIMPRAINRTGPFFPRGHRVGFDNLASNRFAVDRFLRNEFGFNPFHFNRFGFNPFLASQFGVNPFLWSGGFDSLGLAAAPLIAGGATGFSGGGSLVGSTDAGSLADEAKALLIAEQARGEMVANRRKVFDEYLYERDKAPTAEDERQRHLHEQLLRSIHHPPVTEILSGMALNNILHELRKRSGNADLTEPATLSLDEAQLRHINVTRGRGNIALLKNDGRLSWPVALLESSFREEGERLTSQALEAVRQATTKQIVEPGLIRQMTAQIDGLYQKLRKQARNWSSSEYIEANNFLGNLDQAVVALGQPDVASHFNGTYALRAKSVPELVEQMNQNGLEFARAVSGDEAMYVQIHQALAASASAVVSQQVPAK